ncbi:MAG: CRISPR system precrRNA processing endoribonuclease RAMP protein Cas6 [Blastocatellia bacterium]
MFNIAKLKLTIELLDSGSAPGFWGGRLRGIYGHALLKALCDHGPMADYRECPSFASCPYPFLFESTIEARRQSKIEAPLTGNRLPPPFVIDAPFFPHTGRFGDAVSFNLVSLGSACEQLGLSVGALAAFGATGMNNPKEGHLQIRYKLVDAQDTLDCGRSVFTDSLGPYVIRDVADALASCDPVPMPAEIAVEFLTPTRIVSRSAPALDSGSRATLLTDFHNFVLNLCNRIGGLWQLYGEGWPGQAEFYHWRERLLRLTRCVITVDRQLAPFKDHLGAALSHKSSRQGRERDLSGFVGKMRFRGDFSPFWTLLRIGEMVHIGNDTSSGLGQYRMIV